MLQEGQLVHESAIEFLKNEAAANRPSHALWVNRDIRWAVEAILLNLFFIIVGLPNTAGYTLLETLSILIYFAIGVYISAQAS